MGFVGKKLAGPSKPNREIITFFVGQRNGAQQATGDREHHGTGKPESGTRK